MPSGSVMPPRDTWTVEAVRGRGSHRAAFPEELVRIPILSTTPENGVVLDPFVGSGTSLAFARAHGFRGVGIDLNPDFCEQAWRAAREADGSS